MRGGSSFNQATCPRVLLLRSSGHLSRSVRTLASTCSRVPHGTGETEFSMRKEANRPLGVHCASEIGGYAASFPFQWQTRSCFYLRYFIAEPRKHDSVVKSTRTSIL